MTTIISPLLQMGNVLVFYRYMTNYHKPHGLKQHISEVWGFDPLETNPICYSAAKKKSRHGLVGGPSAQSLTRLWSRCQWDCVPVWRFDWRRLCFQIPSGFWQNSFSPGYTDHLSFLSVTGWRQFLSTRGFPMFHLSPFMCVLGDIKERWAEIER